MRRKKYSSKIKNEIKKLYVVDEMSAKEISRRKKSYPSHQTISNWAKTPDKETGLTWEDEREQNRIAHYESIAPQAQVTKILNKVNAILSKSDKSFTSKDADALAKLQKFLVTLTDWRYHAPMMFQLLKKFVSFLDVHYPKLVKQKEFTNAVKHFKNEMINELESFPQSKI